MEMTPKEYQEYVKKMSPDSPLWKDMAMAFLIGGLICVVGQLVQNGWAGLGGNKEDAGSATACTNCCTLLGVIH